MAGPLHFSKRVMLKGAVGLRFWQSSYHHPPPNDAAQFPEVKHSQRLFDFTNTHLVEDKTKGNERNGY